MKKNQRNYWESTVKNMDPDNQLELATILVDELNANEYGLDSEDNYDNNTSKKVRAFLEQYIKLYYKEKSNIEDLKIIDKFLCLSPKSKRQILSDVVTEIVNALKKDELTRRSLECMNTKHTFGEWDSYTVRKTGYDREAVAGHNQREWIETIWFKVCINCGYKEKSRFEPEEVKNTRLQDEKQNEIKRLRTELTKA